MISDVGEEMVSRVVKAVNWEHVPPTFNSPPTTSPASKAELLGVSVWLLPAAGISRPNFRPCCCTSSFTTSPL